MPSSEEAAATAAATLLGTEEETEESSSGEGTETTEEETPEVEMPDFNIELPAELTAELEDFDDEEETDDEDLASLREEFGEESEELLKRVRAAERKAAHYEKLRVSDAKAKWQDEAKKFFPLSEPFLTQIEQTSRRGYLRTAKNIHDQMLPIVEERVLRPARDSIARAKADATAEAKNEAKAAWGHAVDDGSVSSEVRVTQENVERRRRKGEFADVVRNMIFPPKEAA